MLLNVLKLCILLCYVIQNESCTKVSFVNTVATIVRDINLTQFATITITGCISPEIVSQFLGEEVIVKRISCSNQNVPVLHEEAVKNLPLLELLEISESKIKEIKANAFFRLPELQYVFLNGNEIEIINENAFNNLNVTFLSLRRNKLVFIEHGSFNNLPKLLEINFAYNRLEAFEPEWFIESFNLIRIDMSNNYIPSIQKDTFKLFKMIQNIYLNSNLILYIHKEAFHNLEHLHTLYLNDNRIKNLHRDLFQCFRKRLLEELWLNGNNITYISDKMLKDLGSNGLAVMTIHTNPWQCGCYEKILEWAKKNTVRIDNVRRCYGRKNPVCVIPTENEELCLEVREEDFNLLYYQEYNFSHGC